MKQQGLFDWAARQSANAKTTTVELKLPRPLASTVLSRYGVFRIGTLI